MLLQDNNYLVLVGYLEVAENSLLVNLEFLLVKNLLVVCLQLELLLLLVLVLGGSCDGGNGGGDDGILGNCTGDKFELSKGNDSTNGTPGAVEVTMNLELGMTNLLKVSWN